MEFRSAGEKRRKGGQADRTFLRWEGELGGEGVPRGAFVVSLKLTLGLPGETISFVQQFFVRAFNCKTSQL